MPTSNKKNQSVEAQDKDENSILNTVRELVKIRKTYPCLDADADQKFIETGYPAVYERTNGEQTIVVLINPADKPVKRTVEFRKVIKCQNVQLNANELTLNAQSFAILLK